MSVPADRSRHPKRIPNFPLPIDWNHAGLQHGSVEEPYRHVSVEDMEAHQENQAAYKAYQEALNSPDAKSFNE